MSKTYLRRRAPRARDESEIPVDEMFATPEAIKRATRRKYKIARGLDVPSSRRFIEASKYEDEARATRARIAEELVKIRVAADAAEFLVDASPEEREMLATWEYMEHRYSYIEQTGDLGTLVYQALRAEGVVW